MKIIITFTFLLFSYLGFSQATREEVVERNKDGQKLVVNTYTGTGNAEKLIKRTYYNDRNLNEKGRGSVGSPISLHPTYIEYYGKFKEISTYTVAVSNSSFKVGDSYEAISYGIVKTESFLNGQINKTWRLENEEKFLGYSAGFGYEIEVYYILIP
jgi:hypothetical protein